MAAQAEPRGGGAPSPAWGTRGGLAGALAGALCAATDLASGLRVAEPGEGVYLALRLAGLIVPLGAALGAVCGVAHGMAAPRLARLARRLGRGDYARTERWSDRLRPAALLTLASPGIVATATLLYSGGRTSTLPARPLLIVLTTALLLVCAWIALRISGALLRRAAGRPSVAVLVACAAIAASASAAYVDRTVLPGLYDYLHAALSVMSFGLGALAFLALASIGGATRRLDRLAERHAYVAVMALAFVATFDVLTLPDQPAVRAVLVDARVPTARSLMQGIEPVLAWVGDDLPGDAALRRARLARERRRTLLAAGELPTWEGAHVVLVTIDALRADHLGTYGHPRDTSPNIDAFAARSVVFERAYAQAPHSSYSITALMTSEYVHETVDLGLPLPEATLAATLDAHGYGSTALYTPGIFHTEGERLSRYARTDFDFDRHDHSEYDAEARTDAALAEAARVAATGEAPTLFWVHYFDVHEPYRDTRWGSAPIDRYDGEITRVDAAFQRLMEGLPGVLSRDLIVLLSADHGEEFRDHGGVYHGSSLYEEQVRVPLIVSAPDLAPRRIAAPVELVDVAPTLAAMAGASSPPSMRGDDLRALLVGTVDDAGPAFAGVGRKRMVVRWPHKLIADLRFGTYHLFDLEADPAERRNLAGTEAPIREELLGEIYAWIDSLRAPAGGERGVDPRLVALDHARLGDRSAAPALVTILADPTADAAWRREAAKLLGRLSHRRAQAALLREIQAGDPALAAEAAIALGRLGDVRARPPLTRLLEAEDLDVRARAAVALATLDDPAAVPALIEALRRAPEEEDRFEAIHALGELRDPRGVEPLRAALPALRTRRRAVLALGRLGHVSAYEPLVEVLDTEPMTSIRDAAARALGELGDARAAPRLAALAASDPTLTSTSESLVRLGALRATLVGGADVSRHTRGTGLGRCEESGIRDEWRYLERTWCATRGARVTLPLRGLGGPGERAGPALVLLRVRRDGTGGSTRFVLRVGDSAPVTLEATERWVEHRVPLDSAPAPGAQAELVLESDREPLRVDHLLVVPAATAVATAPSPSSDG